MPPDRPEPLTPVDVTPENVTHGPICLTVECITCGVHAQICTAEDYARNHYQWTPDQHTLAKAFERIHDGHALELTETRIELPPDEPQPQPAAVEK